MTQEAIVFRNGRIFDGFNMLEGYAARFEKGVLATLEIDELAFSEAKEIDLNGDILSAGYADLQVNGGGGVMFNDDPSVETLKRIVQAHRALGVVRMLPTLITDTKETTEAAIQAVINATKSGVSGIAGLHLEGPHLSLARKGAHDAALIRPMEGDDLELLLYAAKELPFLKVTIAPENVNEAQVETLANAGALISLGHTDATFETCMSYFDAGAHCVTHLFNAMSQIGNRAPGLVGAALSNGEVSTGLIADGVHVHPDVMRLAWLSKRAPGRIFLVSDAMAVAGTEEEHFELNGRAILRQSGQLRLADGTLAGADLDLTTAVKTLVDKVGISLPEALAAATRIPAEVCGLANHLLAPGNTLLKDTIRIKADLSGVEPI